MNIAIFAYSRQGCKTAQRVKAILEGSAVSMYTLERFLQAGFEAMQKPSQPFYGAIFQKADALVFVGSCGIAVREIAPHVRDKKTDPAVIVIDELGRYVIALLSGHIGGANELAFRLADPLGATAVVTTATDIHRRFSVDAWAARNGFKLSSMAAAKAVSAAILEGDIPMVCEFPVTTDLPNGVIVGDCGKVGIYIGWKTAEPFDTTLRLTPEILHLGIGCRRGTKASVLAEAVQTVLNDYGIDRQAVKCVASIDLKKDEEGLLEFCRDCNWPISFYPAAELSELQGDFTPSEFVSKITGVNNVCERAACIGGQRLIVRKTVCGGVTVAIAAEKLEVQFG